jgi:hypothetical protein
VAQVDVEWWALVSAAEAYVLIPVLVLLISKSILKIVFKLLTKVINYGSET